MDIPVLRETLATFICLRLLGLVNFDYFLIQGEISPWYSLLPLLVMPIQELCEYLEIIKTTEENLIPYVLDERRGGPPWSKMVEHAAIVLDIWRQTWLHNFNFPLLALQKSSHSSLA